MFKVTRAAKVTFNSSENESEKAVERLEKY